ncbi:lysophospholipid acyltransferase [Kwoniella heveanensis CBS 569]|uniref:Lysophospholipid acyltransferase n=1 Tax=Kwoniella heveanensis BCC8398 TaxID=1296120 RepID=A0A1B9GPX1_9TREE|nr:lysophospholipid acyltransferase [Kwoniella heveanensis BCC8398]OCF38513.1 lysophospholipid acyltransferase [Kwoniella heveanensis CBS 569]
MFWDPVFERASALAGAPPDQLKLIFSLLMSYPLGSLFVRLPPSKPYIAHIFSIVVSTFVLWPLLGLGTGLLHLLLSITGTYVIASTQRGKNMPWIAFAFVMGHLLFNHLRRSILGTSADTIEITGSQMVLAMKLTTFAWNIHDGRQRTEDLDASQLESRLMEMPSPLAFLGYCLFFPSVLPGPSFDYATYDALVHHTIYRVPPPGTSAEQAKAAHRRVPYGRKRVAYLHLVIGLLFLGIYALYGSKAAYSRILTPVWYQWSLFRRLGFVQLAGFVARTKYYAVWSLSEGACILTGIGFNGYDPKTGRTLWNRVRNINIISIETAPSFKVLFDSWNCRTNVWLRDVVYKRLTKKGKKPGAKQSMATFVTSAFWHGIDPGYYLAFILGGVLTSLGRQFRRFVRPYFLPSTAAPNEPPSATKLVYDLLGRIIVQLTINYTACAFILLSFKDCIRAWNRMYWYTHILVILVMAFFHFGGRRALRKGLEKRGKLPADRSAPEKERRRSPPPSVKVSPPSPSPPTSSDRPLPPPGPPEDERDDLDLRWVKHALDNPSYQDSGEGMGMGFNTPDGGFLDDLVDGMETPGVEKQNPL